MHTETCIHTFTQSHIHASGYRLVAPASSHGGNVFRLQNQDLGIDPRSATSVLCKWVHLPQRASSNPFPGWCWPLRARCLQRSLWSLGGRRSGPLPGDPRSLDAAPSWHKLITQAQRTIGNSRLSLPRTSPTPRPRLLWTPGSRSACKNAQTNGT